MAAIESQLIDAGITPLAGVDEAGRGACAGPLVIASVVLHDPFPKIWQPCAIQKMSVRKSEKFYTSY